MTVKYNVTKEAYIDFITFYIENTKKFRHFFIFTRILLNVVLILMPVYKLGDTLSPYALLVLIVITLAAINLPFNYVIKKTFEWSANMVLKSGKKSNLLGNKQLVLADDYIEESHENGTAKYKYSAIERIVAGNQYFKAFYIIIGAGEVIIVPLHAFENDEYKHAFLQILKEKTGLNANG